MWGGKRKALTFSFDDSIEQDKRLVEILDKYNLKCTFNVNSGLLGTKGTVPSPDGRHFPHNKIEPSEVKELYKNHEVACHTLTHPNLTNISNETIIYQIQQDCKILSELCGYEIKGMAYPGGGINNDERVNEVVKNHTNLKYARTNKSNFSFDLQSDYYHFDPTVHTYYWDKMVELAKEFLDLKSDEDKIFYIYGHSYEFDFDDTWDKFEEFCKMISGKDDIFYGTNSEILL